MKILGDNNTGKGKAKSASTKSLDLSKHSLKDVIDLMCVIDPRVPYDLTGNFKLLMSVCKV